MFEAGFTCILSKSLMNTRTNTRKPQYLQGFSGFCFVKNHLYTVRSERYKYSRRLNLTGIVRDYIELKRLTFFVVFCC